MRTAQACWERWKREQQDESANNVGNDFKNL